MVTGIVAAVAEACRRGGGDGPIPASARAALQSVSQVLNIHWIHDALEYTRRCDLPAQRRLSPDSAPLRCRWDRQPEAVAGRG